MKGRPLGFLVVVVVTTLAHPPFAQGGSQTRRCADVNWPALQASDPAYPHAVDFAQALSDNGFIVQCMAPSHSVGMFEGQTGAALYRTNRGDFDALFLMNGWSLDDLQIIERQERGRYLYSFAGRPKPWPANLIDASRPVYFIKNINRLIVAHDKALANDLEAVLGGR